MVLECIRQILEMYLDPVDIVVIFVIIILFENIDIAL